MNKCKRWLYNKFLPAYCKEDLLEENKKLAELVEQQRREMEILHSYLDGIEHGLRRGGGGR